MNNANFTDYIIGDKLGDTVNALEFSQNQSKPYFLSAGGWDGKFYLWSINLQQTQAKINSSSNISSKPNPDEIAPYEIVNTNHIITYDLEDPIFSLCWKKNTNSIFAGTVEGNFYLMDLENSRFQKIQNFDTGIREILHFQDEQFDLIITGNYDGIIRLWDIRDISAPVAQYDTNCTIYSMCLENYLLVVGMHNGIICYFNLQKLRQGFFQPEAIFESNFSNMLPIYSMSAFSNMEGFACVCMEGKVSINFLDLNTAPKFMKDYKKLENVNNQGTQGFIFRAHRRNDQSESCMIHQVKSNKVYGTFATCGGDGCYSIWDFVSRSRLKIGSFIGSPPITAINYSMDGNIIAYACGDDWSEGHSLGKKIETRIALKFLSNSEKLKKHPDNK